MFTVQKYKAKAFVFNVPNSASFCLFSFFFHIAWTWESNPGRQDGRRRRIYLAMASKTMSQNCLLHLNSSLELFQLSSNIYNLDVIGRFPAKTFTTCNSLLLTIGRQFERYDSFSVLIKQRSRCRSTNCHRAGSSKRKSNRKLNCLEARTLGRQARPFHQ